jgi:hypothetical protein
METTLQKMSPKDIVYGIYFRCTSWVEYHKLRNILNLRDGSLGNIV